MSKNTPAVLMHGGFGKVICMHSLFTRSPYSVCPSHPAAVVSIILMALCAIIRCGYYATVGADALELLIYLALPVAAALLLIAIILFWGQTHVALSSVSVLLGVVFFMVKATTFPSQLHTALCMVLYVAVLFLFSLTVFGIIPTKKLLYPLFSLPLLYHIFVEDMQIYILASPRPPFVAWLPEISVLCIMGALLALSIALEKKNTEKNIL